MGDPAGGQPDVGLFAGHVDRRAGSAGGRHRQHEERASRPEGQRRTPFKIDGKRPRSREQRRVHRSLDDRRRRASQHLGEWTGICLDAERAGLVRN
jgi:hypothetical protein